MSDRDDLARLLEQHPAYSTGSHQQDWFKAREAADAILAAGWVPAPSAHAVAWQDKANIICTCGQVFSHDYGKSPAHLLGTTSDYYLRTHCGTLYARHLRDVRAALDDGTTGAEATS